MLLLALMLMSQQAASDDTQALFDSYSECVRKNAVAWAKGPDAARDIVAAAIVRCDPEASAVWERLVGEPPINGSRDDLQRHQARKTLLEGVFDGIERRALTWVIEARAKGS